jgi:DNA-binding GntR family transcriptional regulator
MGGFEPIEVRTLADRVYDVVRDRILAGDLAGGDPIRLRGCRRAGRADHAVARAALSVLEGKVRAGSLDQGTYNRIFHMALIRPGAGRVTVSLIERLIMIADRYVRLHLRIEGRDSRANAEHRDILACWIAGDVERLSPLIEVHIAETLNDLRQELSG